jgi:hypothetical protein
MPCVRKRLRAGADVSASLPTNLATFVPSIRLALDRLAREQSISTGRGAPFPILWPMFAASGSLARFEHTDQRTCLPAGLLSWWCGPTRATAVGLGSDLRRDGPQGAERAESDLPSWCNAHFPDEAMRCQPACAQREPSQYLSHVGPA